MTHSRSIQPAVIGKKKKSLGGEHMVLFSDHVVLGVEPPSNSPLQDPPYKAVLQGSRARGTRGTGRSTSRDVREKHITLTLIDRRLETLSGVVACTDASANVVRAKKNIFKGGYICLRCSFHYENEFVRMEDTFRVDGTSDETRPVGTTPTTLSAR